MAIIAIGVLLHWTQPNSFELVVRQSHGRPQGRQNRGESWRDDCADRFPLNPLFCHRSVVKYTSSESSETVMRLNYQILLKSPP